LLSELAFLTESAERSRELDSDPGLRTDFTNGLYVAPLV